MKILKHNLASFKRHGFKRHGFKRHHRHGLSVIEVLTSIVVALVGLAGVLAMIPFSICLLYTSPSPRDRQKSRMPSSA